MCLRDYFFVISTRDTRSPRSIRLSAWSLLLVSCVSSIAQTPVAERPRSLRGEGNPETDKLRGLAQSRLIAEIAPLVSHVLLPCTGTRQKGHPLSGLAATGSLSPDIERSE